MDLNELLIHVIDRSLKLTSPSSPVAMASCCYLNCCLDITFPRQILVVSIEDPGVKFGNDFGLVDNFSDENLGVFLDQVRSPELELLEIGILDRKCITPERCGL